MRAPVIFLSDGTDTTSTQTNVAPYIAGASISGTPTQGQTLTANVGTVTGTPTPTLLIQWRRNGALTGAIGSTYALTLTDVGSTITFTATATNTISSYSVTSSATAVISSSASPFGILDFSDSTNSAHVATIGA